MQQGLLLCLIFFPLAAGLAIFPLGKLCSPKLRDRCVQVLPLVELLGALLLLWLQGGAVQLSGICGFGLSFTAGSLRTLLAVLAAVLWAGTGQLCPSYFSHSGDCSRFYLFWLMTLGTLMGVFLAADLFTLFVFFEMMSFTSYVWVVQEGTPGALRAGETYLAVAVIGGMSILAGLLILQNLLGTLTLDQLSQAVSALPAEQRPWLYAGGGCCLVGFGAKAGMFPLHIWLPKAHPVAPAPASALLSGILTKSGIFGVLIVSRYLFWADLAWNQVILVLGVITMVLGAVLAVFSIDLKRTLACSSMSQIGFILIGVAMQGYLYGENALATWGTVLHMMNHALIKLVLFVAAGVVYMGTHALDLNTIRGWGRDKPWLKVTFFLGAASIAGVPGFSGYVSKTLLHESIVEYIHMLHHAGVSSTPFQAVEWLFLFSGGLTAAYMTKLFVVVFVERGTQDFHPATSYMSRSTQVVLGGAGGALLLLGLTPNLTMESIAQWAGGFLGADHGHAVHYFTWVNLKGACISLAIGAAVYLIVIRKCLRNPASQRPYLNLWPEKLDLEELVYRPFLQKLSFAGALFARLLASAGEIFVLIGEKILFTRAPAYFQPKKDENFGSYGKKARRFLVEETFSFDLILAGAGLMALLLYILF